MRRHPHTEALLDHAQSQGRCAIGLNQAERRALHRRFATHELARPYPNLYARADYWGELDPIQ